MRRKLKETAGLTLVEMLAAVAVLILLGVGKGSRKYPAGAGEE